jgi:hypothetical protein
MQQRETIVKNYIAAYNNFDIEGMLADMDDSIVFENITAGHVNMSLLGKGAFKMQATQAASYFIQRAQTIQFFTHHNNETVIEIDYFAIVAVDLPNGLKKGEEINLTGKSVFTFAGNKITKLIDVS